MRLSGPFSALAVLVLAPLAGSQQGPTLENGRWVRVIYGNVPATSRLRVNAHGPVNLEAGNGRSLTYTVRVAVMARTPAEARRVLEQFAVRLSTQGEWTVLTAPGGAAMSAITVKAPRLSEAVISTSDGAVEAAGVDGPVAVDSGAGEITVDRVHGDCTLATGGGNVRVGQVGGSLRCSTGAGQITARSVRGEAVLETQGGDIYAGDVSGTVNAETGGGGIHIGTAGGSVSATSGGGEIIVDKARGIVTVKNMAGPVQVGSAAGVRCDSGSGGIRLGNISGPMRVTTSMGSILANLLGSRLGDSYLATGGGDITVLIPSNLGVTIQAQNNMADTARRIVSDFRELQTRIRGSRVVAEGPVNGGGPLLQITAMGGTIFIRNQK